MEFLKRAKTWGRETGADRVLLTLTLVLILFSVVKGIIRIESNGASRLSSSEGIKWDLSWPSQSPSEQQLQPKTVESWVPIDSPCFENKADRSDFVLLRARIPAGTGQDSILIQALGRPFRVFQSGMTIYSFGDFDRPDKFIGFPWHLISFSNGTAEAQLYFLLKTDEVGMTGICRRITLASIEDHRTFISSDGLGRGLFGFGILLMGFVSFVLVIITRAYRPFISFAGFVLSMGIWVICCDSGPAQKYLLLNQPMFWGYLDLLSLYLVPPFVILFYLHTVSLDSRGTSNRILLVLRVLAVLYSVHAILVALLSGMNVLGFRLDSTLLYFDLSCAGFLVLMGIDLIHRIRNRHRYSLIFSIGFYTLILVGFHDILVGLNLLNSKHSIHFGLFAVVFCSVVILVLRSKDLLIANEQSRLLRNALNWIIHEFLKPFKRSIDVFELLRDNSQLLSQSSVTRYLYEISHQYEFAKNLACDVLRWERDQTLNCTRVSLPSLVENALKEVSRNFPIKNIRLRFDLKTKYLLFCDHHKVSRVLSNLIGNAFKFVDHSGTIWVHAVETKEKRTFITVGNSGSYIDPIRWDRIGTAFSSTDSYEGVGLGLSIVKCYVEAHGGALKVSSVRNVGTEFSFDLSHDSESADHAIIFLPARSDELQEPILSVTEEILETNDLEKQLLAKLLTSDEPLVIFNVLDDSDIDFDQFISKESIRNRIQLHSFQSIESAVAQAECCSPDLVITDRTDFCGLVTALKAQQWTNVNQKICLAFYGHPSSQSLKGLVAGQFDTLLPKPINKNHFLRLLLSYTFLLKGG